MIKNIFEKNNLFLSKSVFLASCHVKMQHKYKNKAENDIEMLKSTLFMPTFERFGFYVK